MGGLVPLGLYSIWELNLAMPETDYRYLLNTMLEREGEGKIIDQKGVWRPSRQAV